MGVVKAASLVVVSAGRDMGSDFNLPQSDPQTVRQFQKEYLELSRKGDREAPHACFRWVLTV